MARAKLGMMMTLLLFSLLTGGVVAETRNFKFGDWEKDMLFIDNFAFTGAEGRVEVKVTDISFLNLNSNNSLSNMGFFLSDKFLTEPMSDSCFLNNLSYTLYTLDKLQPATNFFNFSFSSFDFDKTRDYILYFQICDWSDDGVQVTMNGVSSMYNLRGGDPDFLSPHKTLVTKLFYPFFALVHFSLACLWASQIPKFKTSKKTMSWLLLLVPYLKAWSLILGMLHNIYIMKIGCADCWLSVLLGIASDFLREAPLAVFLVLFSTGFLIVKPKMCLRDKTLIVLQIFAQLVLVSLNILGPLNQSSCAQVLYLSPGTITTYFCVYVDFFLHQFSVKYTLKFLPEVARGNYTDVISEKQTPMSLLKFAELLKSLCSMHLAYLCFQMCVIIPLEIFWSNLPLIVTLKEFAALWFYVKVASRVRTELWILKLLEKDCGRYVVKIVQLIHAYDDIEKGGSSSTVP